MFKKGDFVCLDPTKVSARGWKNVFSYNLYWAFRVYYFSLNDKLIGVEDTALAGYSIPVEFFRAASEREIARWQHLEKREEVYRVAVDKKQTQLLLGRTNAEQVRFSHNPFCCGVAEIGYFIFQKKDSGIKLVNEACIVARNQKQGLAKATVIKDAFGRSLIEENVLIEVGFKLTGSFTNPNTTNKVYCYEKEL